MIMRKLIIAVLVLISLDSFAQPLNYTWYKQRIRQYSLMIDSAFYVPRYNGTPSGVRTNENSAIDGAVAIDTANGRQYFYYNGSWRRLANYSELGVDSIWRVAGIDSIFWSKAGNTYKIKDSTGGGSTPTLQQVLTAGSTLTVSNSIDAGGFNFNLRQVDTLSNAATIKEDSLTRYIMVTPNYESSFRIRDNGVDALIVDIGDVEDSGNGTNVALSDATGIIQLQAQLGGVILDGGYTKILNLANATTQDVLIGQTNISDELGYITIGSGLSLSSGVLSASGGGGGGSGTVNTGTDKRVAYYSGTGTTVDDAAGFEIGNTNNRIYIQGQSTTEVPLIIQSVSSQTADLFQFKNSSGTVKASMYADGSRFGFGQAAQGVDGVVQILNNGGQSNSLTWSDGATSAGYIRVSGSMSLIGTSNGSDFGFVYNGSEKARVNSVGVKMNGRFVGLQGADVASAAGAITLGSDGNVFEITGTSSITAIVNTNWQNGATITLMFTSTATLTDGTANSGTSIGFELAGNTDFTATTDDVITLVLSEIGGTQRWREVSRSVN